MSPRDCRKHLCGKSDENWDAGEILRQQNKINAAANRYYYAMFHAAWVWADKNSHLRIKDGTYRGFHDSLINIVSTHAGSRAKDFRNSLNNMFGFRVTADYEVDSVDKADLESELTTANGVRQELMRDWDK